MLLVYQSNNFQASEGWLPSLASVSQFSKYNHVVRMQVLLGNSADVCQTPPLNSDYK